MADVRDGVYDGCCRVMAVVGRATDDGCGWLAAAGRQLLAAGGWSMSGAGEYEGGATDADVWRACCGGRCVMVALVMCADEVV